VDKLEDNISIRAGYITMLLTADELVVQPAVTPPSPTRSGV
jgi:hypothetical protein